MSNYFQEDDHYSGQLNFALWRRIFSHAKPYRMSLFGLAGFGLVIAAVDTAFPYIVGLIIDEAVENGLTNSLYTYAGAYASLFVFFAISVWAFIIFAGNVATGVAADLRTKGFRKLQELSFSYFDVRPIGWLLTRITSDCSKLSSLMPWFTLDLVWGTSTITFIIIAMCLLNWKLALVVMTIVPLLALISIYFQKKLLDSSRLVRKTNSQMTAGYNEAIMGVRTTKALVREEANLSEFQNMSTSMFNYSMRNALQSAIYLPAIITIGSLGVGLALWRGGVNVGGEMSLGTLVAFMQYATLFYMPIQELARRFTELQSAQAAAERVQSLLDEVPSIRDSENVLLEIKNATTNNTNSALDGGDTTIETIEFKDANFWYKEGEPVLKNFNLAIKAGQTIALVGATGGGKSTIVSLAARFYEPSAGEILINGGDYRTRSLHWLQSNLGVVLQTPHLFSGTIKENIRYGKLDATDEEIQHAAMVANAHEFIGESEKEYETEVGEGGSNLSTGQRQLVSLARAVLADPQIFIMDEATSSVDTETERLIQDGIDAVLKDRIAFVIAHRLSTIRNADVILVIDSGEITEQGTHVELIAAKGRYYELYTRQFTHQREENVLSDSAQS